MPSCSIKQCSARRTNNLPTLSVHRFPRSKVLHRKWLEAIGIENINAGHKEPFIASLHFEESQFNKTLDVIRLRDNAVPTLFNKPPGSIHDQVVTGVNRPSQIMDPDLEMPSTSKHVPVLSEICNMQVSSVPATGNLSTTCEKIGRQSEKKLQKVCEEQRKKIKKLNEKIRRQGKKNTSLQDIITDLNQKLIIKTKQSMLLEHCSGSQAKLPQTSNRKLSIEYSEEIRKFALTLHFFFLDNYIFYFLKTFSVTLVRHDD